MGQTKVTNINIGRFSLIAILNFLIYLPSFLHMPRSDQLLYLYYNAGKSHWIDLTIKLYDFNRTLIWQGGDFLFRPIVYFLLGTEKWLFGYHFFLWQLVGFILHMIVVWYLLKLLLKINNSIFAYLFSLFFSTLLIIFEMVIFHHINAYLLFLIAILIPLNGLMDLRDQNFLRLQTFCIMGLSLLVACFTFEMGFIYSVLFAFTVFNIIYFKKGNQGSNQRSAFLSATFLLLPAIFYGLTNYFNLRANPFLFNREMKGIMMSFNFIRMLKDGLIDLFWWIISGMFPGLLKVYLINRTQIVIENPFALFHWKQIISVDNISFALGIMAIFMYGSILQKTLNREYLKKQSMILLLVGVMTALFIGVVICVRANVSGGLIKIETNSYYSYFIWLFLTIFFYALVDFKKVRQSKVYRTRRISMTLIIALIIINGMSVFAMNWVRAREYTSWRLLASEINREILAHKNTNDFTFRIIEDEKNNPVLPWVKVTDENKDKKFTYFELLYPQYYAKVNPKFVYGLTKDGFYLTEE